MVVDPPVARREETSISHGLNFLQGNSEGGWVSGFTGGCRWSQTRLGQAKCSSLAAWLPGWLEESLPIACYLAFPAQELWVSRSMV